MVVAPQTRRYKATRIQYTLKWVQIQIGRARFSILGRDKSCPVHGAGGEIESGRPCRALAQGKVLPVITSWRESLYCDINSALFKLETATLKLSETLSPHLA